jgi:hypothetical protein
VLSAKTQAIHQLRRLTHYAFAVACCQQALVQAGGDVRQARALLVNDPRKPSVFDYIPANAPPMWGYIITKVVHYRQVGCTVYRKHDAFHMPNISWDEETLQEIDFCFGQFLAGKGLSETSPVEGVSVGGFYAALATLHFEMIQQSAIKNGEYFVDAILFKHSVEGSTIELFNKVPCEPLDWDTLFPDEVDSTLYS